MIVFFRVDSSIQIGSGHVMRCLTLADRLQRLGAEVIFVSRDLPGHCGSLIQQRGHRLSLLPPPNSHGSGGAKEPVVPPYDDAEKTLACLKDVGQAVDWLIVDHYGLDQKWEAILRPHVRRLMVIDDLANRPHICDLLLEQNYCPQGEARYRGLVPDSCKLLLGPRYALLRPEFYEAQAKAVKKEGPIRRLFVFFGGSDPTNETEKALKAIEKLNRSDLTIDVVVGASNPNKKHIQDLCERIPGATFHCQINHMASLMAEADLAIGAGGATNWERCYLGLPALAVTVADNQMETTEALMEVGALRNLGVSASVTVDLLAAAIAEAIKEPEMIREMGLRAKRVMGDGGLIGVEAVVKAMREVAEVHR